MVQKKSVVRFAAFAGVMVVMSGLVLTLFDEARAIDVEYTTAPTSASQQTSFIVNVNIPQNTRIPVESVIAFVEQGSSNADPKQGASLVTKATCSFSAVVTSAPPAACRNPNLVSGANPALTRDGGLARPDGVHSIIFNGFFQSQAASGYEVGYGAVYSNGPLAGTTTGYGYNPVYGYGYSATPTAFGPENGYGYGYTEDLFLQFEVVVVGTQLATGAHYLTVGVDTGSPTLGDVLYSPSTEFEVFRPGNGGGTRTGDTTDGSDGSDGSDGGDGDNTVSVPTTTNPNPPANAESSYTGTVKDAKEGTKVVLQTEDPRIKDVEITLGMDAGEATVEVSRFATDDPPEGVGTLPEGVRVTDFVQVKISVGGQTHVLSFAVEIPEGEAGDPNKAVLLKYNPASGTWVPQNRIQLTLSNGVFSGQGSSACCSDFAVGFDEQPPTVGLAAFASALSGAQTLTAEAEDNLQVSRVDFFFGERLLGSDDSAPYTWDIDTTEFSNGDWTLKAVAHDFVGNSAEDSQQATFSNEAEQSPTDDGDGGDGSDGGAPSVGVILLVLVVLAAMVGTAVYFMRQQK